MGKNKTLKLVISAMFAALVCVATMIIKIQTPTNGYINLGDCMVLLSGWILGPVYGVAAAAIGSCLADLFAGYPAYALATFVIKGAVALVGYVVYRNKNFVLSILSAVLAEALMAVSYFVFEFFVMGYGFGAIAGMPANCVQGAVGAILAILLLRLFTKNKLLSEFFEVFKIK